VAGWFSRLERRALRRGRFTSVAQLKEAIEHFIEAHNDHSARPFRWTKTASLDEDGADNNRVSELGEAGVT